MSKQFDYELIFPISESNRALVRSADHCVGAKAKAMRTELIDLMSNSYNYTKEFYAIKLIDNLVRLRAIQNFTIFSLVDSSVSLDQVVAVRTINLMKLLKSILSEINFPMYIRLMDDELIFFIEDHLTVITEATIALYINSTQSNMDKLIKSLYIVTEIFSSLREQLENFEKSSEEYVSKRRDMVYVNLMNIKSALDDFALEELSYLTSELELAQIMKD